jgi:hypothetical protein
LRTAFLGAAAGYDPDPVYARWLVAPRFGFVANDGRLAAVLTDGRLAVWVGDTIEFSSLLPAGTRPTWSSEVFVDGDSVLVVAFAPENAARTAGVARLSLDDMTRVQIVPLDRVENVGRAPGGGILVLREDGTLAQLDPRERRLRQVWETDGLFGYSSLLVP